MVEPAPGAPRSSLVGYAERVTRRLLPTPASLRPALGAAALVPLAALLAGCQWTSPIQTDSGYEPADGSSVSMSGVHVNNVLIVADEKGGKGTLVGTAFNDTPQPVQVSVALASGQSAKLDVPAGGRKQFSDPQNGSPATLPNLAQRPGALVDATVEVAGVGSKTTRLPVLAPYAPYGDYSESGTRTFAPTTPPHEGGGH